MCMVQAPRRILKIISKARKKVVLFKAKFKHLFIVTKKPMMKQKLIIIFILFSIICIKKHFSFYNLKTYLNTISFPRLTKTDLKH